MFECNEVVESWISIKDDTKKVVFKRSNISRVLEVNGEVVVRLNDGYEVKLPGAEIKDVCKNMGIKF